MIAFQNGCKTPHVVAHYYPHLCYSAVLLHLFFTVVNGINIAFTQCGGTYISKK